MVEYHALAGQPVEIGRIDLIAAVGAHVRPAHVVGDDEHDIRRCAAGFLPESVSSGSQAVNMTAARASPNRTRVRVRIMGNLLIV